MRISELINDKLIPLRAMDTVASSMQSMLEHKVNNLPLIDFTTKKLIGEVLMQDIETVKRKDASVMMHRSELVTKVSADQHVFEAARILAKFNRQVVSVLDHNGNYLGIVSRTDVLEALSGMLNLAETGSVITIELDEKDFVLSDIVRIIELEGGKILGLAVEHPDQINDRFRVSIKLNLGDITKVNAALRRYGYIITLETKSETSDVEFIDRADEFIRFLNI
ncbi:MAG: HPP family protein [Cyclonatronaceae bacterium]